MTILKTIDQTKHTCVETIQLMGKSKVTAKLTENGIPFSVVEFDEYDGVPNVFKNKEVFIPNEYLEKFAHIDLG